MALTVPQPVIEKIVNKYNVTFGTNIDPSAAVFSVVGDTQLSAIIGSDTIDVECLQSFCNYGIVVSDFKNTGANAYQVNAILGRDTMINTGGTFNNVVQSSIESTIGAQESPMNIAINVATSAALAAAPHPPAPAPAP